MTVRLVALAAILLACGIPTATRAQDTADNPNAGNDAPSVSTSVPTTSRDPRGDYTGTTTSSRFQRRAPAVQPSAAPTATAVPAIVPSLTTTRAPAPLPMQSSPQGAESAAATGPVAATKTSATPPTIVRDGRPAPADASGEAGTAPFPASSATSVATSALVAPTTVRPPSKIVSGGQENTINWLPIVLATMAATIMAGLAVAKVFMPWPRPRLTCEYQFVPQDLPSGSLALQIPDIMVRAEATRGAPMLSGAVTIEHERWDDE